MFLNYAHTVSSANTPVDLFTVSSGKSMLVLDISVAAGGSAGVMTFTANDGAADVFAWPISLQANELADISPQKIRIFEEGYTLKVQGAVTGLSCFLGCVEK